ncbi:hypothetical protein BDV93DRAFT_81608 [Ceratobasidium sp. AG-I]|nr:hypothetical protein BDV93DRAFT_81608 [Ceratobasidium sp. AG-I]
MQTATRRTIPTHIACGTVCQCPECAHHRQRPHNHQPRASPVQGHGGEPCPIRCANCFDCAGGLTLLLDPAAYPQSQAQGQGTAVPPYSAQSDVTSFTGQLATPDPNASVHSFDSDAPPFSSSASYVSSGPAQVQVGVYPTAGGQFATGSASFGNGSSPAFYPPGMDPAGMDVEMDNAEFNAAMAGLDAGIGAASEGGGAPGGCACPAGRCACPGHQNGQDAGSFWDRPRCGFAVSTERGGCCSSPDGVDGHAHHRLGSDEVGSELGVGSDGGIELGSELGIGSDGGIGSDAGSVVGVGTTNLSMDFADLDFGGLALPPMQYGHHAQYSDHAQRYSGEYTYQSDRLSAHGDRFSGRGVASNSSQFSNHSNLSLVSSIDSASVSLASLASSHGISSLASSHGIPSLASSHGIITPHSSPLSGRITPNRSGRITPVRGVTPGHAQPGQGKPLPRGYRRILPKVAAMTTHRPFRRHSQQPSLHAVMESDLAGVTSPPPSQVLLQPPPQGQGGYQQQPRVRKSVRSHLPIVGKYFAPGGRYEPSRLRNLNQPNVNMTGGGGQAYQQQQQAYGQGQSGQMFSSGGAGSASGSSFSGQEQYGVSDGNGQDGSGQGQGGMYQQVVHKLEEDVEGEIYSEQDLEQEYEPDQDQDQVEEVQAYQSAAGQDYGAYQTQGMGYASGSGMGIAGPSTYVMAAAVPMSMSMSMGGYSYGSASGSGHSQQHGHVASSHQHQHQQSSSHQYQQTTPLHHQPQRQQTTMPAPPAPHQASQSYSHLPRSNASVHSHSSVQSRPHLPLQHSSQTATGAISVHSGVGVMPSPNDMLTPASAMSTPESVMYSNPDSAMHSPQPLPADSPAPPSPPHKVSSGVPMPLTMSLPTTGARAPGAMMSRTVTHHAYEDGDADEKRGGAMMGGNGKDGGVGVNGRKSRWPSFSVHGHRVMVGAKVMGAAYAGRP